MSPPWQAQPKGAPWATVSETIVPRQRWWRPASQAAVRSTVPVRPAAAVTRSPPEQFGPVGQRLAALADAGLNGQVARNGSCGVTAGQGPDGRTVMWRTARAAPS
jgi:hypothetical protein